MNGVTQIVYRLLEDRLLIARQFVVKTRARRRDRRGP